MKIILCIFLLNITAVSVFGQSVELNGTLGESVKFPAAVEKGGFLMYSGVIIGEVTSGSFTPSLNGNYRDRLQWDSSTGFFSLSGLKLEDSGEYKVQIKDQNIITVFQLNVYKDNVPVSKPHVSITHNEYPCTIECTANGGTLSWYRKGQKKSFASSHGESAPHLNMTVESGTYTCEAKNSFSKETSDPLTVGAHCTDPTDSSTGIIVASVIIAAVAVLIAVFFALKYHRIRREIRGDAVQPVPQSGNRSKPSTKYGFIRRCPRFIRGFLDHRTLIQDNFVYRPEAPEKMTSSHQTEVPLNQDTEGNHERRIEERDPTYLRDDLSWSGSPPFPADL